jgi:hypothetical protein
MIPLPEPDRLGLRSSLQHRGASEFQILDEGDAIAVSQHGAVGILNDARAVGDISLGGLGPFKATGDAFPFVGMFKDFIEGAFGTGGMGHRGKKLLQHDEGYKHREEKDFYHKALIPKELKRTEKELLIAILHELFTATLGSGRRIIFSVFSFRGLILDPPWVPGLCGDKSVYFQLHPWNTR